jgi:N-glycosidase YbiA
MSSDKESEIYKVTDNGIYGFFGDHRFLSNFHLCNVEFEGMCYPSSENAYMAAKTSDLNLKKVLQTMSPKKAKSYGRTVPLRENWDSIRLEVMEKVLLVKFSTNPSLREKLLETGDKYLEETNWWKDTFWGVCNGKGENNLGKILMKVREKLRLDL